MLREKTLRAFLSFQIIAKYDQILFYSSYLQIVKNEDLLCLDNVYLLNPIIGRRVVKLRVMRISAL